MSEPDGVPYTGGCSGKRLRERNEMAKKYTPPANKEIKQWVAKIAREEDRGNNDEAIRLLDGAISVKFCA